MHSRCLAMRTPPSDFSLSSVGTPNQQSRLLRWASSSACFLRQSSPTAGPPAPPAFFCCFLDGCLAFDDEAACVDEDDEGKGVWRS